MTDALVERIVALSFFVALSDTQYATLAQDGVPVAFAAGERLFTEGGIADRFWLIEDGGIALDMRLPGRGDQILETLMAGTVLGWSWMHPPYRWHFGAIARVPTSAIAFDATSVRHRCDTDPAFGYAVFRSFAPVIIERLQATRMRLLDIYATPAQARQSEARR